MVTTLDFSNFQDTGEHRYIYGEILGNGRAVTTIEFGFGGTQNHFDYSSSIIGTQGDDGISAPAFETGGVTYYGGGGNDLLSASNVDSFLVGGDGNDFLYGGNGNDVLYGDAGDDQFVSRAGADIIIGGDGIDTVIYGGPYVFPSDGPPLTVDLAAGQASDGDRLYQVENVTGGAEADSFYGNAGANVLDGYTGDDFLIGGAGADTLIGGDGIDQALYTTSSAGVSVNLETGTGLGGDAEGDVLQGIENLTGSNYADVLTGDAGGNIITGSLGNDTLNGGAGDDVLLGGAGGDILNGGDGADSASYRYAAAGVTLSLLTGGTGGEAAGDQYITIEHVEGSNYADTIAGNNGSNTLDGGTGNDVLRGGLGADTLIGGDGFDIADYKGSAGVKVDLAEHTATGGEAQGDVLTGIEGLRGSDVSDVLTGDAGANTLYGEGGGDTLTGGDGNDNLYGGDARDALLGGNGDDTLIGGLGNDALVGGAGIDVANYASATSAVALDLGLGQGTAGEAAGDTYSGVENALGSGFADTLTGSSGANSLWGMAGTDVLVGGGGADALKGGAGADSFVYKAVSDSLATARDSIGDFSHAEGDRIDLSAIDADGNAANGNNSFTFIGSGAFTGAGHELQVVTSGGVQLVQADLNGDKIADMSIVVISSTTLLAGDFVL